MHKLRSVVRAVSIRYYRSLGSGLALTPAAGRVRKVYMLRRFRALFISIDPCMSVLPANCNLSLYRIFYEEGVQIKYNTPIRFSFGLYTFVKTSPFLRDHGHYLVIRWEVKAVLQ